MKFSWAEFKTRSRKSGCVDADFTPQVEKNAKELIRRINKIGRPEPRYFSSCLRSRARQIKIYNDKGIFDLSKIPLNSAHITGEAVDIYDTDRSLCIYLQDHPEILESCDLYMEDPRYTNGWTHLQSRKTKSGKRIFIP